MGKDKVKIFKGWDSIADESNPISALPHNATNICPEALRASVTAAPVEFTYSPNNSLYNSQSQSPYYPVNDDSLTPNSLYGQTHAQSGYIQGGVEQLQALQLGKQHNPYLCNSTHTPYTAFAGQPTAAHTEINVSNVGNNGAGEFMSASASPMPYSSLLSGILRPFPEQFNGQQGLIASQTHLPQATMIPRFPLPDLNQILPPIPQNTHAYLFEIQQQQRQRLEYQYQSQVSRSYAVPVVSASSASGSQDDDFPKAVSTHASEGTNPPFLAKPKPSERREREMRRMHSLEPVINLSRLSLASVSSQITPRPPATGSTTGGRRLARSGALVPMAQLTRLGPDLDTEDYQMKAIKMERLKTYSSKIRSLHRDRLLKQTAADNGCHRTWDASLDQNLQRLAKQEAATKAPVLGNRLKKSKLSGNAPPVLLKQGSRQLKSQIGLSSVDLMIHDKKIQEEMAKVEERLRVERRMSYYQKLKTTQRQSTKSVGSSTADMEAMKFSTPQPLQDDCCPTQVKLPSLPNSATARATLVKTKCDNDRRKDLEKLRLQHQKERQAVMDIIYH